MVRCVPCGALPAPLLGVDRATLASRTFTECEVYIEQLRRWFGSEPRGSSFAVKGDAADADASCRVVYYYDTTSSEASRYARRCETECPTEWDDEAKEVLAICGSPT